MHRAPFTADLLVCGHMRTTRDRDTNSSVLHLRGEFDCSTVDVLVDRLEVVVLGDATEVVVDLAGVTFLDSATVRAFENAAAALSSRDRTLVLRDPPTFVRRVLQLCGASSLIAPGGSGAERRASGPGVEHIPRAPTVGT